MSNDVIVFDSVSKMYKSHAELQGGIKNYVLRALHPSKRKAARKITHALHDISFRIPEGTVVGFVGRNGAGKSTLLGLMAGILKPSSGTITIRGRVSTLLELGVGFHPDLTGRENALLYGILMGYSKKYVLQHMEAIIDFSEIVDFIDTPVRFYSNGMLARLGFAVISQLDMQIILIDEVLGVGDFVFQEKCIQTMEKFKQAGKTIILVSHTADTVSNFCDRAIWISDHTVKMDGPAKEVVEHYKHIHETDSH